MLWWECDASIQFTEAKIFFRIFKIIIYVYANYDNLSTITLTLCPWKFDFSVMTINKPFSFFKELANPCTANLETIFSPAFEPIEVHSQHYTEKDAGMAVLLC